MTAKALADMGTLMKNFSPRSTHPIFSTPHIRLSALVVSVLDATARDYPPKNIKALSGLKRLMAGKEGYPSISRK